MSKYVNIQMTREIHAIVKEHAKKHKQTISGCIEELVEMHIMKEPFDEKHILRVK